MAPEQDVYYILIHVYEPCCQELQSQYGCDLHRIARDSLFFVAVLLYFPSVSQVRQLLFSERPRFGIST